MQGLACTHCLRVCHVRRLRTLLSRGWGASNAEPAQCSASLGWCRVCQAWVREGDTFGLSLDPLRTTLWRQDSGSTYSSSSQTL